MGLVLTLFGGLAATVVTVWLWVRYSLASPALMLEKQGVISLAAPLAKLVRGSWWRVLGTQLLTYLLIAIVEFIIQIPATLVAFSSAARASWTGRTAPAAPGWSFLIVLGVGAVISSTITFPISAGVTALLYMDQRVRRRKRPDLELARAAGLPGYGADAPHRRPGHTCPRSPAPADCHRDAPAAAAPIATADTPAKGDEAKRRKFNPE